MATLRLTLEYDGTGFRGWARQPGERTVEGVLRDALDVVVPSWDGLAVAGRTDAGVHATGQVASLEAGGGPPAERLAEALNTALPRDVAVLAAEEAPDGFHARFSASARSYRYVVLARRERAPLRDRRALWWPRPVDLESLRECAAALLVNPYDPEGVAIAINRALSMPLDERRERQAQNYRVLVRNDITHWAERFLALLEPASVTAPPMAAAAAGE